jgi:signal transduction histidine kinase
MNERAEGLLSLDSFRERLRKVSNVSKLMKMALRELQSRLATEDVAQASHDRALGTSTHSVHSRSAAPVDDAEVEAALLRREIPGRKTTLALRVCYDERFSQIIALRRDRPFDGEDVKLARRILNLLEEEIGERNVARRAAIVERVYTQLLRRQTGNDLHYQILHAVRDLIDYDHSGAVFVSSGDLFRLQAEQIAWTKGRSDQIGRRVDLPERDREILEYGNQPILFRRADAGSEWEMAAAGPAHCRSLVPPAALLDLHVARPDHPTPCAALVSPLTVEDRCVGLLAAFGREPLSLSESSSEYLLPLLPLAAISIQNQLDDEGMRRAFLEEQKKHAIADIARGVAHDINNSLAVLLMRSRVLRDALRDAPVDERLHEDIRVVEKYALSCKRIFQGMLQFARTGATPVSAMQLQNSIRNVMDIQHEALAARGVVCSLRVDPTVPEVRGNQQQIERVIHNLVQNARQACGEGDRLVISLKRRGDFARLVVANSGQAIPAEILERVMEPFFSTRPDGHGLGLSLCRSIVADHRGSIRIQSREGTGTIVSVKIPLAEPEG